MAHQGRTQRINNAVPTRVGTFSTYVKGLYELDSFGARHIIALILRLYQIRCTIRHKSTELEQGFCSRIEEQQKPHCKFSHRRTRWELVERSWPSHQNYHEYFVPPCFYYFLSYYFSEAPRFFELQVTDPN